MITILYGSETGTAEEIAIELSMELDLMKLTNRVLSCDQYSINQIVNEQLLILLIATHGQGDPPTNMISFWKHLRIQSLPSDCLESLQYAIFGLGDSGYKYFNGMARKLDVRLQQLGATIYVERGLGDDRHSTGYRQEYIKFRQRLFNRLGQQYCLDFNQLVNLMDQKQYPWKIQSIQIRFIDGHDEKDDNGGQQLSWIDQGFNKADILSNKRVTNEKYVQDTRVVRIDGQNSQYQNGDIVQIISRNDKELCSKLGKLMLQRNGIDQKYYETMRLKVKNKEILFKDYLEWEVELEMPKRRLLRLMGYFNQDYMQRERLLELADNNDMNNVNDYQDYVVRAKRNFYDVLFDFDKTVLPIEYLDHGISSKRIKEYSIASYKESNIEMLIGIIDELNLYNKRKIGVFSNYLLKQDCYQQDEYHVYYKIKKGTLKFDYQKQERLLIVCAGTGIAAFIAYLKGLKYNQDTKNKVTVVFGNRQKNEDYYYQKELEELQDLGLIELKVGFSRDQSYKVYVQHLIREHYKMVGQCLLDNGQLSNDCRVMVSGRTSTIPKNVEQAIIDSLTNYVNDQQKAQQIIKFMIDHNRYVVEAWG